MEIYLIRHTTPLIDKGVCYGQSDVDVAASFLEEADCIAKQLPPGIKTVYSSPLKRCSLLVQHLFPSNNINWVNELQEIHFGEWEMKPWDQIDKQLLQLWMADFVNVGIPGGESYLQLYHRVSKWFQRLPSSKSVAIVAHSGVIRCILAHINEVPLKDSFNRFKIDYGCVLRIIKEEPVLQTGFQ